MPQPSSIYEKNNSIKYNYGNNFLSVENIFGRIKISFTSKIQFKKLIHIQFF